MVHPLVFFIVEPYVCHFLPVEPPLFLGRAGDVPSSEADPARLWRPRGARRGWTVRLGDVSSCEIPLLVDDLTIQYMENYDELWRSSWDIVDK